MRIFYAAGPGNVIDAHRNWEGNIDHPHEVSITYSGQFADFCRASAAKAYIVSSETSPQLYTAGDFSLEHRPKRMRGSRGLRYHVAEVLYGLGLFATALRFRANAAVLSMDTTHPIVMSLFR